MSYPIEIIAEKYKTLPEDIRMALADVDMGGKINLIADDQGLLLDQAGILAEEIGMVMLGMTHPNKFVTTIEKSLGITHEKANEIAEEVNTVIFQTIRSSLQKIHAQTDDTVENIPNRESILRGIEEPEKMLQAPVNALELYRDKQIHVSQNLVTQNVASPILIPSAPSVVPKSAFEQKLSTLVKSEPPVLKQHDPYREAI